MWCFRSSICCLFLRSKMSTIEFKSVLIPFIIIRALQKECVSLKIKKNDVFIYNSQSSWSAFFLFYFFLFNDILLHLGFWYFIGFFVVDLLDIHVLQIWFIIYLTMRETKMYNPVCYWCWLYFYLLNHSYYMYFVSC